MRYARSLHVQSFQRPQARVPVRHAGRWAVVNVLHREVIVDVSVFRDDPHRTEQTEGYLFGAFQHVDRWRDPESEKATGWLPGRWARPPPNTDRSVMVRGGGGSAPGKGGNLPGFTTPAGRGVLDLE